MSGDPFERDLIAALRAEAYSVPLRLQAEELHGRLAPRTRLLPARLLWRFAGMAVIAIALGVLLVTAPGRLGIPGPAATAECEVSAVTRHGSWWEEIGGENAFFNASPGQLYSSPGADWLIHVRFDPAPEEGQQVSMWAQRVGDEERVAALLGERADLENIHRFDERAPALPGALYLFQQPLPAAGCWQLVAAIEGEVAGSAVVDVRPGPEATPDPIAPTPRLPEPSRTPLPAETPAPSATDLGDEVVRDGDSVTAGGKIVQLPGDTPRLCFYLGVTTGSMSQPVDAGCHPLRVPVDGVDLERLPGWTERGGGGMSGYLEVKGTWAEGTLVVRDVSAAIAPRPFVIPPAPPCEAPPGGWPGRPSAEDAVEAEASSLRLTDEVDANPALYSGIWVADLEGAAPIVVGTVGKVEEVRERLAEIFPYNMCVVKVDYSAAQLQPVADRLAQSDGSWWTDVDPATARVLVDLPVLDEEAVSRIGADADKVTVRPLVARAPDSD
jgi:hypothetical protein